MKYQVKARKVGDSVVITLSKTILEESSIAKGDILTLETVDTGLVVVSASSSSVSPVKVVELEIDVLRERLNAVDEEIQTALWGVENSAPTEDFPWVDDQMVVAGAMRNYQWTKAKIQLEIAEKTLEWYKLGGEPA